MSADGRIGRRGQDRLECRPEVRGHRYSFREDSRRGCRWDQDFQRHSLRREYIRQESLYASDRPHEMGWRARRVGVWAKCAAERAWYTARYVRFGRSRGGHFVRERKLPGAQHMDAGDQQRRKWPQAARHVVVSWRRFLYGFRILPRNCWGESRKAWGCCCGSSP